VLIQSFYGSLEPDTPHHTNSIPSKPLRPPSYLQDTPGGKGSGGKGARWALLGHELERRERNVWELSTISLNSLPTEADEMRH
jgi:hypothetical protein